MLSMIVTPCKFRVCVSFTLSMFILDSTEIRVFCSVTISLEMGRVQSSTGEEAMMGDVVPHVQEVYIFH